MIGTQLGHYLIVGKLGAGGMGEVYRAHDVRLGRDVAVKILPESYIRDRDRLERSEREARLLASLNHPNIAALYGLEEKDGTRGLVLELVDGVTLEERLATSGTIATRDALRIAHQMADALEAAHQKGIVHRDLKPANIKITPDGTVKVLDFGIATLEAGAADAASVTMMATAEQTIVGTAAYMSPEQARGEAVDKRADIWAFGCVLFEMLTGHRAFDGGSVAGTFGKIMHEGPSLDRLPASTPPHVGATIERCLQKDVRHRARDIADVRMALEGAFGSIATAAPRPSRARVSALSLIAAAIAGALFAGTVVWLVRQPAPPVVTSLQFHVTPPDQSRLGAFFSLSPDHRHLAFNARDAQGRTTLWLHSFTTGRSRRLERAGAVMASSFWSPDSQFIGYVSSGELHRIDIGDTPPVAITKVESFGGGTWTRDGTILYGEVRGPLRKVSSGGGEPVAVTALDDSRGDIGHTNPVMLPDGRRFLYFRTSRIEGNGGIFVGSLDRTPAAQPDDRLLALDTQAAFSPTSPDSGHLVFVRDSALMAQELDVSSMTVRGAPRTIADRVAIEPARYAQMAVTGDSIAFRRPEGHEGGIPTWFDRTGRAIGPVVGTHVSPAVYPQLSPDGTRVALVVERSLWVYSLDGRPPIRLTSEETLSPLWSRDGQQIVFERFGTRDGLHAVPADGSTLTARPVSPGGHYHAYSFTADGRELVAGVIPASGPQRTSFVLVRLGWPDAAAPTPLDDLVVPDASASAALSPDGHWLAYIANVTGSKELWVRRYPALDAPVRVSPNGASEPTWAKNGRELFYLEGDALMTVPIKPSSNRFDFAPPIRLFAKSFMHGNQPPSYDVAADGRFLMLQPAPLAPSTPIEVILNWRAR